MPLTRHSLRFLFIFSTISAYAFYSGFALSQSQTELFVKHYQQQLHGLSIEDEKRVLLILDAIKFCWNKCPNAVLQNGEEAFDHLKVTPNTEQLIQLAIYMPRIYIGMGQYDKAQVIVDYVLPIAEREANKRALTAIQYVQAVIYSDQNQYVLAENAYLAILATYKDIDYFKGVANTLNNLGRVKSKQLDYGAALAYYQQSLSTIVDHQIDESLENLYANIADIYNKLNAPEKASEAIDKALSLISETTSAGKIVATYIRQADIQITQKDFDGAAVSLEKALTIAQANGLDGENHLLLSKLALVEMNRDNIEASALNLEKATNSFNQRSPNASNSDIICLQIILAIRKGEGNAIDEKFNQLLITIQSASISDHHQLYLNLLLTELKKVGNWKKTTILSEIIFDVYQQQVSLQRTSHLEQFDSLYQLSERQRQIAELENDNKQKELAFLKERSKAEHIVMLALSGLVIFIFLLIYLYQKRKFLAIEKRMLETDAEKKRQLFSEITHELRNPLSALKLQVEMLQYDIADDTEKTYRVLHQKLSSINHIVDDISNLARAEAGELDIQFELIELYSFINDWLTQMNEFTAAQGFTLNSEVELTQNQTLMMDPYRITQVLNNLISNACRYTDAPGTIRFIASINKGGLNLTIEDSPPGISDQQLANIFERSYRVNKEHSKKVGGSGLGLNICKSFVEAHGGSISATHANLGGIRIEITLPCDGNQHN